MSGLQKDVADVVKEEREKKAKAKEEEKARKKRKWEKKVARKGREAAREAEAEEMRKKITRLEAESEQWKEAWRIEHDLNVELHTQCVQFHDELVRLRAERADSESDEGGYDTSMSD